MLWVGIGKFAHNTFSLAWRMMCVTSVELTLHTLTTPTHMTTNLHWEKTEHQLFYYFCINIAVPVLLYPTANVEVSCCVLRHRHGVGKVASDF